MNGWSLDPSSLRGRIAVVAGATRGAGRGIAAALGEAGATVVCTGRSTRANGSSRSDYDRPETIDETAELVTSLGGTGVAIPVDHLNASDVETLADRLRRDYGHIDVLVNDIWGAEVLKGGPRDWNTPIWKHDLAKGLRILRLGVETHLITSHYLLPLLIAKPGGLLVEVTDGTSDYNAAPLPDLGLLRSREDLGEPSRVFGRARTDGASRDGGVGHSRVAAVRDDAGELRCVRVTLAGRAQRRRLASSTSLLRTLGVAEICRAWRGCARCRSRAPPMASAIGDVGSAGGGVRVHGRRRITTRRVEVQRGRRTRNGRRPQRLPLERLRHLCSVGSPAHRGEATAVWRGLRSGSSPRKNGSSARALAMTAAADLKIPRDCAQSCR